MTQLKIYNSMSRQKEDFKPLEEGKVKMYVCGVTVYDYCHLGHARALITFDMIYRYLMHAGYDVLFVRNFTDIDDKIINRSNELGIDYKELTEKFITAFHEDTNNLKLKNPSVEPKATEHIQEIIDIVKSLEEKEIAYQAGNDVFFSVRKFEEYGKLSGKNIEDLEVGARVDVMEQKKDPLDFALWKGAKPDEPSWDSPWGKGRPGWHIECSAMSMKYLSSSFDIHGGGRDLIFPHHENEIAQSEACTGNHFAKYWVHNGFVNINAEKMSKSLGNFLTIHELLEHIPAEALRLFILSSHYRSPIDYTEKNIENALSGLERFYQTKQRVVEAGVNASAEDGALQEKLNEASVSFTEAMNDDFNTAKVIGQVFELVREINKKLDKSKNLSQTFIDGFNSYIRNIDDVLNLFGMDPEAYFKEVKDKTLGSNNVDASEVESLIQKRKEARQNKDWKLADEVRDQLASMGVQLKDNPDGTTTWSV